VDFSIVASGVRKLAIPTVLEPLHSAGGDAGSATAVEPKENSRRQIASAGKYKKRAL
jgi:hypothetical protein